MRFADSLPPLAERDVSAIESALGIVFPAELRTLYLHANGGIPEPYVFENDDLDTVVSEFLPLDADRTRTAAKAYRRLVLEKRLVPLEFFPFAIDGGGNYFFVDTDSPDGTVHFHAHDTASDEPLRNLHVRFAEFWSLLKDE